MGTRRRANGGTDNKAAWTGVDPPAIIGCVPASCKRAAAAARKRTTAARLEHDSKRTAAAWLGHGASGRISSRCDNRKQEQDRQLILFLLRALRSRWLSWAGRVGPLHKSRAGSILFIYCSGLE